MSSIKWNWPVPGVDYISSHFGSRDGGYHYGTDIAAGKGTPIVATREGTVTDTFTSCTHNYGKTNYKDPAGCGGGYGNRIFIDHGDGYESRYAHLTDVYVKVGDIVTLGQEIGTMGTTGDSSGDHLHFEIRYNGDAKNPENFVSSSGLSVVSSEYDPSLNSEGAEEELNPSYYTTVEAGGTTVGQRVSGLTPQPLHPFINIYIGETAESSLLLSTEPPRPNIIQSFEYDRLEGVGDKATLTIFDDNWEEIEKAISSNYDNIWIEYGYHSTGVKSRLHRFMMMNYTLSFTSTGTLINVELIANEVVDNLKQTSLSLDTYNPTEAVKKICKYLGYTVLDENFDSSKDIISSNPFNLVEEFPLTYIYQEIIPQASQENEELFSFKVDSGVAYFKRESYADSNTDTLRTYIFQKGYDSTVLDFEVDMNIVKGGAGRFQIATEYRSTLFDTANKEQESSAASKSSVVTSATGEISHVRSDQSNPIVDSAGYSPSQMKNKLYYHMKSMDYDQYAATLTILGDPTVMIYKFIRVINVTDKGHLHHTSGVYWIQGVTDSIQGGQMTTVLKLVKNATSGDVHGVEIINPKLLIK